MNLPYNMNTAYPIGFWNYPHIGAKPISEVARWKNAGITCNQTPFCSLSDDPALMTAMLDEMAAQGIRAFVCVSDLDFRRFTEDPDAFRGVFEKAYALYGHHPATYGFFIGDEPISQKEFAACVSAYKVMRELAPELTPLLNFNPYWMGMENDLLGGESFDAWIDRFIQTSGCPLICYDCYWQMNPEEDGTNMYFLNLHNYVGAAKRNGIMVWNTLLSVGHFRYRVPNEDDLRWQVSTTVASGCDGILWFLWYGQGVENNYRGAPVDELGEESETYAHLRRVQQLFHYRYGSLIRSLHFESCYHFVKSYGDYPLLKTYDVPHVRRAASDHGLPGILSTFVNDAGERYLVLVNNSPKESDLFSIVLDPGIKAIHRFWDGGRDIDFIAHHHDAVLDMNPHAPRVGLWLAPGQMEVLKIEY